MNRKNKKMCSAFAEDGDYSVCISFLDTNLDVNI